MRFEPSRMLSLLSAGALAAFAAGGLSAQQPTYGQPSQQPPKQNQDTTKTRSYGGRVRADTAAVPRNARFRCVDGTYSTARRAKGACATHGGISDTLNTSGNRRANRRGVSSSDTMDMSNTRAMPDTGNVSRRHHRNQSDTSMMGRNRSDTGMMGRDRSDSSGMGRIRSDNGMMRSNRSDTALRGRERPDSLRGRERSDTTTMGRTDRDRDDDNESADTGLASRRARSDSGMSGNGAAREEALSHDSTNATAKCKDGTWSHSRHRSGACSSHGGVDQWKGQSNQSNPQQ